MNDFNKSCYDYLQHHMPSDGAFLQDMAHFADYTIFLVIFVNVMLTLFSEKMHIKASVYLAAFVIVAFVAEASKHIYQLHVPDYNPQVDGYHFVHNTSAKATFTYMMGTYIISRRYRLLRMLLMGVLCMLMGLGRVYTGLNYASEIFTSWIIIAPIVIGLVVIINQLEALAPKRRQSDQGVITVPPDVRVSRVDSCVVKIDEDPSIQKVPPSPRPSLETIEDAVREQRQIANKLNQDSNKLNQ